MCSLSVLLSSSDVPSIPRPLSLCVLEISSSIPGRLTTVAAFDLPREIIFLKHASHGAHQKSLPGSPWLAGKGQVSDFSHTTNRVWLVVQTGLELALYPGRPEPPGYRAGHRTEYKVPNPGHPPHSLLSQVAPGPCSHSQDSPSLLGGS